MCLLDAKAKFSIKGESNVGLKIIASDGLKPLIGLMTINTNSLFGLGIFNRKLYWGPVK